MKLQPTDRIIITGAAGFIGSYLAGVLNSCGCTKLVLVDDFSRSEKKANYEHRRYDLLVERTELQTWLDEHGSGVKACFHLGARTDTTEMDYEVHRKLNLEYSKMVWQACITHNIPLLYASSAATYGNGEHGYDDEMQDLSLLEPLNPYGLSKHQFDIWALAQSAKPPFFAGVKFFNVYGPNEYHKGRMASVMLHAYRQIKENGSMKLFRSHNPAYSDGGQMRDFVYVADVCDMIVWLMEEQPQSGLYNIGSGKARTFLDLAKAVFRAMDVPENISFVDTPADIREKYQYFTEAKMTKLQSAGYSKAPITLEHGIKNYVQDFLATDKIF